MARKTSLADALPQRPPGGAPAAHPTTLSETGSRARRVLPVDLASIEIPPRLRAVDPETVSALADSIARISLQNPIILQMHPDDPGLLLLVSGAHRLQAVRELGWPRIEALVVDGSPEEIGLIEIDENLIRKDLTPLDRARFLAQRKAIYAKLYRGTGRGGDRRSASSSGDTADRVTASTSWAQDAADLVGISPRAVHRAVAIGTGLSDELADALADTPHRQAGRRPVSSRANVQQGQETRSASAAKPRRPMLLALQIDQTRTRPLQAGSRPAPAT